MAFTKAQLDAYIQALYDDDGQLSSDDYQLIINYILSNGEPEVDPRDLIQVRRGNEEDLPNLAQGEPAYTLDTEEFFVGGLNGNVNVGGSKLNIINVVKKFGSDVADIQAAFDYVSTNGGILYFENGNYLIDSELNINLTANKDVAIYSDGDASFVFDLADDTEEKGCINIIGNGTQKVAINNVSIKSSNVFSAIGLRDGLYVEGLERFDILNSSFDNFNLWGILCYNIDKLNIIDVVSEGCGQGGLGVQSCTNVFINGGSYSDNGLLEPSNGYGLSLATKRDSGDRANENCIISNVVANSNKRNGIDVHNGLNVVIEKCFVESFGRTGIRAICESESKQVKDIVIRDNFVKQTSDLSSVATAYGFELGAYGDVGSVDSGSFIIVNNIVDMLNLSQAIAIDNPSSGTPPASVTIQGNTIINGTKSAGYIIETDNKDVDLPYVNVIDNDVHANNAIIAIGLRAVEIGKVSNNRITLDTGTCANAIIVGGGSSNATIVGNTVNNAGSFTGEPLRGYVGGLHTISNNYLDGVLYPEIKNTIRILYDTAPPIAGLITFTVGSLVFNTSPSAGGNAGWICTVTGNPGTWKAFGTIEA